MERVSDLVLAASNFTVFHRFAMVAYPAEHLAFFGLDQNQFPCFVQMTSRQNKDPCPRYYMIELKIFSSPARFALTAEEFKKILASPGASFGHICRHVFTAHEDRLT